MARKPTRAEIIETNPNMTKTCDSCSAVAHANKDYGTFENWLTLTASGGYGEFVDTIHPNSKEYEFNLCHKCAHKLMKKFFSQWSFNHWHPRTDEKFCDGWTLGKSIDWEGDF